MSLINKMLRDLDERQAAENAPAMPRAVRPSPAPRRVSPVPVMVGRVAAVTLLVAVIAGLAYVNWPAGLKKPQTPAATPAPAIPASGTPVAQSGANVPAPASKDAQVTPIFSEHAVAPAVSTSVAINGGKISTLRIDAGLSHVGEQMEMVPLPDKLKLAPVVKSAPVVVEKVQRTEGSHETGAENYRKGLVALRQARTAEGIELLQTVLRENPRQIPARQTLLSLFVEQKQWEDAQTLLKNGLDALPEQAGWAMTLARIQVELGYTGDAWTTLQKHQAYAEQNAEYQGFAGILLQQLQKPREAATYYRNALQLRPGEGRWWYGLGMALEADSRSAEAREAFQKARTVGGITPEMRAVIDKKMN